MKGKLRSEIINEKCELLKSLGFNIHHLDMKVEMTGIIFDFSATEGNVQSIMYEAVSQAYRKGFKTGQAVLRREVKTLLGIDQPEE